VEDAGPEMLSIFATAIEHPSPQERATADKNHDRSWQNSAARFIAVWGPLE
jgi:hypothetical protein